MFFIGAAHCDWSPAKGSMEASGDDDGPGTLAARVRKDGRVRGTGRRRPDGGA
jgi:hypothetical protein